jgi:hypothetical protein
VSGSTALVVEADVFDAQSLQLRLHGANMFRLPPLRDNVILLLRRIENFVARKTSTKAGRDRI